MVTKIQNVINNMNTILYHLVRLVSSYLLWLKTNYSTEILYKSINFLIINKEPDLKINSNNSKEKSVQVFLRKKFPHLTNKSLTHEFYFPHRLDFATSGLLCIPLHKKACQAVSQVFLNRESKKYYVALVRGLVSQECLDIDLPIGEDVRDRLIQKMCTADTNFCSKARTARTKLIVLTKGLYNNYPATKVLMRLVTGRRHQIRVHLSSIGHTIVGDFTYSNRKDIYPPRMYLHSLRLVLPTTFEYVDKSTNDPFSSVKLWKEIKVVNTIDSAYLKLDENTTTTNISRYYY